MITRKRLLRKIPHDLFDKIGQADRDGCVKQMPKLIIRGKRILVIERRATPK
jgi:hypothetical protein